jgi:peptide/nickel transport system permease protein
VTVVELDRVAAAPAARRGTLRAALSSRLGGAGAAVTMVLVAAGVLAAWLAPYDPAFQQAGAQLLGPRAGHLLGTDELGRDILSRLLYGIRQDVFIAAVAVPVGTIAGVAVGLVSTLHPALDAVVQRMLDVVIAFPGVILGAALAAFIGPGFWTVVLVVVLISFPTAARLTRAAVLSQRERDYVRAARVVGVGRAALLFRHILPNALEALVVNTVLAAAAAIFIEGGLSIIGFGIRPPAPSLGAMIDRGLPHLSTQPWYTMAPILALTGLVIGLNLFADAVNRELRHD